MKEGTNDVTRPVFSTDGLIWVCCYLEREIWWASNPTDPDPDEPAHEGSYEIGALMVFNGKQQPPKYIPLIATISSGWLPPDLDDDAWSISDPVFIDAHYVTIHLPSGESQIHFVSAE